MEMNESRLVCSGGVHALDGGLLLASQVAMVWPTFPLLVQTTAAPLALAFMLDGLKRQLASPAGGQAPSS